MKLDRDRWCTFFRIDQTNMRFTISDFCCVIWTNCLFLRSFSESTKFSKLTLICRQILSGILEKLVWTHIFLSSISQNPAFDIQKTKRLFFHHRRSFFVAPLFPKFQHLTSKRPRILYLFAVISIFEIRHPKDQGVTSYFRGLDCWRSRTRPLRNFRILLLDSMTKNLVVSENFFYRTVFFRELDCEFFKYMRFSISQHMGNFCWQFFQHFNHSFFSSFLSIWGFRLSKKIVTFNESCRLIFFQHRNV